MKALALALLVLAIGADFAMPPVPRHYVTDNAGALSASTRDALESRLRAYEAATGHQVIVWIGQTTGDVPLETWTGETADHWKVGRKGHDDGAVLFLFMQDHKARIEVGYGLEGALPDADAYRIIQDAIVPRMRSGDVDGAVTSGVAAMLTTITPAYKGVTPPPQTSDTGTPLNPPSVIALVVLAFLVILALMVIVRVAVAGGRRGYFIGSGAGAGGFLGGFSGGGGGGDFDGGGFSAGGGSFGGGGASGGW